MKTIEPPHQVERIIVNTRNGLGRHQPIGDLVMNNGVKIEIIIMRATEIHYHKRLIQLSDGSRQKPRYEQVNTTATMYHKSSSSKTNPCEYELDLQFERRPLSPVNKLDPKDPRVKAKVTTNRAERVS